MSSPHGSEGDGGTCPDCGAPVSEGRAGCQRLFDETLAREFGDYRYARRHRLTVDTYALQHPERYMRTGKSFAAHLTGMYAALEGDASMNPAVQRWLNGQKPLEAPEPPSAGTRGTLTVAYVLDAGNPDDYLGRVQEWARSTWDAWNPYHDLARRWIEQAMAGQSRR